MQQVKPTLVIIPEHIKIKAKIEALKIGVTFQSYLAIALAEKNNKGVE